MSGYLSRLVMRSQTNQLASPLQPFIRSTSPIAQQDQRLGLSGYELIGQREGATALLDSREMFSGDEITGECSAWAQDVALSATDRLASNLTFPNISSDMPSDSLASQQSSQQTNIQRKEADTTSSAYTVSPSVSPSATSSTSLSPTSDRFTERAVTAANSLSVPDALSQKSQENAPEPFSLGDPSSSAGQRKTQLDFSTREVSKRTQLQSESKNAPAVRRPLLPVETFPNSFANLSLEETSAERDVRKTVEQPSITPNDARSSSLLRERSESVPSLEPAIRSRLVADSARFETAATEDGQRPAGPAVMIGRINVEVVAPSAQSKAQPAARSGPVTAASVSVIGPLRRGVRSNVRYSLEQW